MTVRRHPLADESVAALALTGFSLIVVAGFARVFSGWGFFDDLAAVAVLVHGLSYLTRRTRLPSWVAVSTVVVVSSWAVTVQLYSDTMGMLLPQVATWDRLVVDVELALEQFPTAVAPVIHDAGWATLAAVAVLVTTITSDTIAFRTRGRAAALVPGVVSFVAIAGVSAERLRVPLAAAFVGVAVCALTAVRQHGSTSPRMRSGAARPVPFTAATVIPMALVVSASAALLGPALPGAGDDPWFRTRGRSPEATSTVNPLVDIRSRLSGRDGTTLFRVEADQPAYWRTATLVSFDGRRFTPPETAVRPGGDVDVRSDQDTEINVQQVRIVALDGRSVPAAADPIGAEGISADGPLVLRLDRSTSSLLAPDDHSSGDLFTIHSRRPRPTPADLRNRTSTPPDPVHVRLPDDFPEMVGRYARQVTAGSSDPYGAALALQNWFRDPDEFSYSLEVQAGHGSTAIESFFVNRVGYCEQFAATFAAMARTLGIPTRVAVGFTSGTVAADGWFDVSGTHAHAWPEVWFDGIGWLAFEPTPGRGQPGAETYTEVAAVIDAGGDSPAAPDTADSPTAAAPAPAPTTGATAPPTTGPTTSVPDDPAPGAGDTADSAADPTGSSTAPPARTGISRVWWVVAVMAAAAGLRSAMALRRRRLRRRDLRTRAVSAWERAVVSLPKAGVTIDPTMTVRDVVDATSVALPDAQRPIEALADVMERLVFAPSGEVDLSRRGVYGDTLARECEIWSDHVVRVVADSLPHRQRIVRTVTRRW